MVDILSFRGQVGLSGVEGILILAENGMDKCTEVRNDMLCGVIINLLSCSIT